VAAIISAIALPAPVLAIEDEILVTARKREENLQEIPLPVTAFSSEQLERLQIQTIDDVGRNTPGLSFAKAFGRTTERPVIRGLGNVLAGVQFGVESGAAYFVDGIYYPGDLQSLNIRDIERVEVIKGPQSALYGRNTYSGAINFVTRRPGDSAAGDARMRFGQDGDFEITGGVDGPLVEGVLDGGLSARYYSFDGEYTNIVTGETVGDEQTRALSGSLRWTPHEDLTISTRLNLQNDDDGTRAFFLQPSESNNCFPGTRSNALWNSVTGSTNQNQYFCGEINRPADYVQLNDGPALGGAPPVIPGVLDVPFPGFGPPVDPYNPAQGVAFSGVERDLFYLSLQTEWDIQGSGWTAVAAGAYREDDRKTGSDSDHTSVNYISTAGGECGLCASERDDVSDYSVELRLESPVQNRLRGLIGTYYFDQEIDGSDITFTDLDGGDVNERETTKNWAVFAQLEYDILENVTLGVEGRYFDEEKSLFQRRTTVDPTPTNEFDDSIDFSEFAPRVTLDWRATDDLLVYAIYAKGFKPGGLNGRPGATAVPPAPTYDQEESDNYELGLKATLFDGRMTLNTSVFYIDVSDIQLTTPLATGAAGTLTSIVTNQGSGEVTGAEVEATLYLTDAITVGATYALADTEFTEGCDEFQWTLTSGGGILNDAANCTGFDPNGEGDGSIKGNAFPLSSKNQFSAYADFRTAVFDAMEFFATADVSYEDKKPVQVHNLAFVPEATILNARLGIDTGTNVTISIYGRNLTDEDAPSMVTRWLQDPLTTFQAVGQANFANITGAGACTTTTCARSYPRAFFGDMRRGRNFGVEFAYKFGGDR